MTRLSRYPVPPTRLWAVWSYGHLQSQVGLPRAWHLAPGTWSTWKILPVSAGLASTLPARQAGCVPGTRAAAACAAGEAMTPRAAWWLSPATARCSGAAMWSASSVHSRNWCIPASARPPPGETVVLPGLPSHRTPASTYLPSAQAVDQSAPLISLPPADPWPAFCLPHHSAERNKALPLSPRIANLAEDLDQNRLRREGNL